MVTLPLAHIWGREVKRVWTTWIWQLLGINKALTRHHEARRWKRKIVKGNEAFKFCPLLRMVDFRWWNHTVGSSSSAIMFNSKLAVGKTRRVKQRAFWTEVLKQIWRFSFMPKQSCYKRFPSRLPQKGGCLQTMAQRKLELKPRHTSIHPIWERFPLRCFPMYAGAAPKNHHVQSIGVSIFV